MPNCNPPLTKKVESELTLLANSESSSLFNDKSKKVFNPLKTDVPLLDPPPSPAFVGIFFLISISTLGICGKASLIKLKAFVLKLSSCFI